MDASGGGEIKHSGLPEGHAKEGPIKQAPEPTREDRCGAHRGPAGPADWPGPSEGLAVASESPPAHRPCPGRQKGGGGDGRGGRGREGREGSGGGEEGEGGAATGSRRRRERQRHPAQRRPLVPRLPAAGVGGEAAVPARRRGAARQKGCCCNGDGRPRRSQFSAYKLKQSHRTTACRIDSFSPTTRLGKQL